jgi:hypothetical protein
MKNFLLLFIGGLVAVHGTAGALTINKAPVVAKQEISAQNVGGNLLPTVVGLVSGIQALNQKQKDLTAECIPSSQEVSFVNNMIKEWAKTGAATASELESRLNMKRCEDYNGGYENAVRMSAEIDATEDLCYDSFGDTADKAAVWYQFPKAVSTYYCTDGSISGCNDKYRKYVSNIYDVFNLIDFSKDDYTADEAKMATTLMSKIESCSYAKISAKKKALWGDFLTTTVGGLGQKTNTASVMDIVSGMSGSLGGGGLQSLSGIGNIATQLLNK